ncbi:MAG: DMT family transporter [bacterium]
MNKNKGLVLILCAAFISGIVVFISKFGVSVVNPYIFTGLKNIIVVLLVVCWLLMFKDWKILKELKKNQWLMLAGVGLIGGSIPFLLYFKGLSLTVPIQAAFIHKTMFIFIAVLAVIFLKEKINKEFLIGGLLLFLGNILLLNILSYNFGFGDLLILIATLFWACENILSKYLLKDLSSRIVIWARMFFGSIFIILFWIATGQAGSVVSLSLEQWGWVMITSVFLFGYVATWYTGLKYVKVSTASVVLLLASPITIIFSFWFLGEKLLFSQIIGVILIILAVLWICRYSIHYVKEKPASLA